MRAGFLQFEPVFGKPDENISRIDRLIPDKSLQSDDLLVIPELANSGYLFSSKEELSELSEEIPGRYCNFLCEKCFNTKSYVVSGICEREDDKYFNSAILVHPDGKIDTYRKIHLFYEEKLWFTPGNIPLQTFNLETLSVKIGIMVCFDWRFPEIARTLALKGAQIICHPANLVMPHCQDAMVIRALENQVFTITANRIGKDVKKGKELAFTGRSIMVNPKGDVIYIAAEDSEEFFINEINPDLALDKMVTEYNNIFEDRREELYFK
jgi:predicted amidohydrolase